jgi:hypothetical protein
MGKWHKGTVKKSTHEVSQYTNGKACLIRFYNLVLLPRVRDDIAEYKKLNPHLYMVSPFVVLGMKMRYMISYCYDSH